MPGYFCFEAHSMNFHINPQKNRYIMNIHTAIIGATHKGLPRKYKMMPANIVVMIRNLAANMNQPMPTTARPSFSLHSFSSMLQVTLDQSDTVNVIYIMLTACRLYSFYKSIKP